MCDTSLLRDITLIIHCRQTIDVCQQRRPLLQSYSAFFKEVIFLLKDSFNSSWTSARRCYGAGDPYWCISEEMRRTSASGILYMQFDVALAPCELAKSLNPEKVGHFQELSDRYFSFETLDSCRDRKRAHTRCWWYHWNIHENRSRILNCRPGLNGVQIGGLEGREIAMKELLGKLDSGIWWSIGDFFYLPRLAFPVFAGYAPVFREQGIHHELASPTLLTISAAATGAAVQDLGCLGDCCSKITKRRSPTRELFLWTPPGLPRTLGRESGILLDARQQGLRTQA